MTDTKDYIDKIIDLFLNQYKAIKNIDYAIGRGKKNYYPGPERSWVATLISAYKQIKPESDTPTAMRHIDELFKLILSTTHSAAYLNDVTLFKVCCKLNDYRLSMLNRKVSKGSFDGNSNEWKNTDKRDGLVSMNNLPALKLSDDDKFHEVTRLPKQNVQGYTDDELAIIKDELFRLAAAKDVNYTVETINEWIRTFGELNWSCARVVKAIRLAKINPVFVKGFPMFTQENTNDYYRTYEYKK